jgi:hypothetical protein
VNRIIICICVTLSPRWDAHKSSLIPQIMLMENRTHLTADWWCSSFFFQKKPAKSHQMIENQIQISVTHHTFGPLSIRTTHSEKALVSSHGLFLVWSGCWMTKAVFVCFCIFRWKSEHIRSPTKADDCVPQGGTTRGRTLQLCSTDWQHYHR